jgi:hypothetical protein
MAADGGLWGDGYLTAQQFQASPVSSIAATGSFKNGPNIRVYYQGNDGYLYETTNTKQSNGRSWGTDKIDVESVTVPLGASIAGTFLADEQRLKVYTTNARNELIELHGEGGVWRKEATLRMWTILTRATR